MKRLLLSAIGLLMIAPLATMAQNDDVYFVPTKKEKAPKKTETVRERPPVYAVGTVRDVDEYNRRNYRSSYVRLDNDSTGDDIIDFYESDLPDTLYLYEEEPAFGDNDYYYSRMMSRFDDFYGWYPYYYRSRYYWDYPYWRGPYLSYSYYWGDPWYDPWYYGWHGGYGYWWHPYSYYGGWYRPAVAWSGHTGTRNHGHVNRPLRDRPDTDRHFGSRSVGTSTPVTVGTFGTRSINRNTTTTNTRVSSGVFGGSRANTNAVTRQRSDADRPETFGTSRSSTSASRPSSYDTPMRSGGSFGSGSGSFGGSRSGGGSFGGSRSGGGGHFGGGRR